MSNTRPLPNAWTNFIVHLGLRVPEGSLSTSSQIHMRSPTGSPVTRPSHAGTANQRGSPCVVTSDVRWVTERWEKPPASLVWKRCRLRAQGQELGAGVAARQLHSGKSTARPWLGKASRGPGPEPMARTLQATFPGSPEPLGTSWLTPGMWPAVRGPGHCRRRYNPSPLTSNHRHTRGVDHTATATICSEFAHLLTSENTPVT